MGKKLSFLLLGIFFISVSCSSSIKNIKIGQNSKWATPYVAGMDGVENLVFDGDKTLFATDLHGTIYAIEATNNPYKGKIVAKKKIGKMCLGIAASKNGYLYVAIRDKKNKNKIIKITKDFKEQKILTDKIEGLNGFALNSKEELYISSSNFNFLCPKGKILKISINDDKNFASPVTVLDKVGLVNGFTFSKDEKTLYFTETTGSLWKLDLSNKKKKELFKPKGFLQLIDDIEIDNTGIIWLCYNTIGALVPIKKGIPLIAIHPGKLKVPSACKFGKGKGFNKNFLYVSEIGLKGNSLSFHGRGIWIIPIEQLRAKTQPVK